MTQPFRADLDPQLADFLVRACAPTRVERFQTAVEMDAALREVRDDLAL